MQVLCHRYEISSIIYNFSAYNTILVSYVIISIITMIILVIDHDMKF